MMRIVVVGAGGHGQVVADALLAAHEDGLNVVPIGFVDDAPELNGRVVLGLPVRGPVSGLDTIEHDAVVVAVGDNACRRTLTARVLSLGSRLASAIHPRATLGRDVQIGVGVMICAGAVVNTGSRIGVGAILNTGCTVDHHNVVGGFAHVAPGVHLGGSVTIGEGAIICTGSSVVPGCSVGAWAIVGAGSVVIEDIPPYCTAVGIPARVIKRHEPQP